MLSPEHRQHRQAVECLRACRASVRFFKFVFLALSRFSIVLFLPAMAYIQQWVCHIFPGVLELLNGFVPHQSQFLYLS